MIELDRLMRLAEQHLHDAMEQLAQAEKRLASLPARSPSSRRRPDWFTAALAQEGTAVDRLESIFREIAGTPAHTSIGLGIKMQTILMLYGVSVDDAENDGDMVLSLLKSVLADLGRPLKIQA